MLKKLPFILLAVVLFSIILDPFVPYSFKSIIYSISLTVKSIVLFILPFLIFSILLKTFIKLSRGAASIIFLLFTCVCVSNFFNTFSSHYIGSLLYHIDINLAQISSQDNELLPYFTFLIPSIIKNEYALISGILCGVLLPYINSGISIFIADKVDIFVQKIFSLISCLIPLFVIGFVVKCASDGILMTIITNYSQIFFVFLLYASIYICLIFLCLNKFNIGRAFQNMKNIFPAFLTGMSTMSSALTMPVTILSVEKDVKNKSLASSVTSIVTNIHLLGDCLFIPMLAYAVLKNYGYAEPSTYSFLIFTIFFCIAKFSVAAVPGGGIIVMTPILEKYLGFSSEMSTLIIAIYIAFDPIITGFNVVGNGAFAKFIDNLQSQSSNK